MDIDDIKLLVKKGKKNSDANNKNIQPGCRDGIWHIKMCHANSEKWKKTNH